MLPAEIGEWIKWLVIVLVAVIIAWEKAKRWHYRRTGKDRRNSNPNLEQKLLNLCRDFKNHEKNDKERTKEIKDELRHLREEQGRQAVSIGTLKGRMNAR